MKLMHCFALLAAFSVARGAVATKIDYEPALTVHIPQETLAGMRLLALQEEENAYVAELFEEEDGAVAALRFVERYSDAVERAMQYEEDDKDLVVKIMLDIASIVNEKVAKVAEPITHICKGGKKCTAAKLLKRGQDSGGAGMYDEMAFDMLRALAKKNTLEAAFVNKLEVKLKSALNGLNSQRKKEEKEREEELLEEKRREEEAASVKEVERRKMEEESDWRNFEAKLDANAYGIQVNADGTTVDHADYYRSLFESFSVKKNYTATVEILASFPPNVKKSDAIWLIQARSNFLLGDFTAALHAAGVLVQNAASHSSWERGEERLMAVNLGANAAMVLGKTDSAKKFYQAVLKFDPDNKEVRKQYKLLKDVIKIMSKAEKQIVDGYNKKGVELIHDCLSKMRGLDVDSLLFRSVILLKLGRAESSMNKHEEALEHLDFVIKVREEEKSCSPKLKIEAYKYRAEANMLDDSYDDAVNDYRSAMELAGGGEDKRELQMELNKASRQRDSWNGGQKDHYYNEHNGFPDGRPPERDNIKILGLPVNLAEHPGEVACSWVRKQYKQLARKYHPDKYKGNVKRAQRKFDEIAAAKKILEEQWKCRGK